MLGAGGRRAATGITRHRTAGAGRHRGGENRKFLDQFLRAAMRADRRAGRLGGADEQLKIFRTLGTMKFVQWHGRNLIGFLWAVQQLLRRLVGGGPDDQLLDGRRMNLLVD